MKGKNPIDFNVGDWIESIYTGEIYQLAEMKEKQGMAKLKNEHGALEDWNACNNAHFIDATGIQLKMEL